MFAEIEKWTMTMTKMEVMATLNELNVPCGPILSMKELAEEPSSQDRNGRRSRPSQARQVSDRRQSDQAIGLTDRVYSLALRRTHRRSASHRGWPERRRYPGSASARRDLRSNRGIDVLILGASYGSLFGTKLLMAGHRVSMVCTKPTADLINREGTVVRFPIKGRGAARHRISSLPGTLSAATPDDVDPGAFDLIVLGMQEASTARAAFGS